MILIPYSSIWTSLATQFAAMGLSSDVIRECLENAQESYEFEEEQRREFEKQHSEMMIERDKIKPHVPKEKQSIPVRNKEWQEFTESIDKSINHAILPIEEIVAVARNKPARLNRDKTLILMYSSGKELRKFKDEIKITLKATGNKRKEELWNDFVVPFIGNYYKEISDFLKKWFDTDVTLSTSQIINELMNSRINNEFLLVSSLTLIVQTLDDLRNAMLKHENLPSNKEMIKKIIGYVDKLDIIISVLPSFAESLLDLLNNTAEKIKQERDNNA